MNCSKCGRPIIKRNDEWQHQASDRPGVSNVFDHKARPSSTIVEEERRESADRRRKAMHVNAFLNRRRRTEDRRKPNWSWNPNEDIRDA